MNKSVFFIDDDERERRGSGDVLRELFEDTTILIETLEPLASLAEYSTFVANHSAAALILDERLNTTGVATYTGIELAAHLRAIGGGLPIFILTNFPPDEFPQNGWAVENIFAKRAVLTNPASPEAEAFKLRLSRQIETYGASLAEREQRYHDLLVKSATDEFSAQENEELSALESDRIAPVAAAERQKEQLLDAEIEKIKRLLGSDRLL